MNKSPNLFIIGAPKCGTTTLHYWLSLHQDIFMTSHKEPTFFCGFANKKWYGPGADVFTSGLVGDIYTYESLFKKAEGYKWRGESSTDYLWVEEVPLKIMKHYGRENKKFLVVLRNPIDRAFSEHSHLIREGRETLDFISSIEHENDRFEKCWQPLFYHVRRGLYSKALQRYFSVFGRENVKIIHFDDLKAKPKEVFAEVCEFLGIQIISPSIKSILNKSGKPRFRTVHNLLKGNNFLIKKVKNLIGPKKSKLLRSFVDELNLKRILITEKEQQYLQPLFIKDIESTEKLLKFDLSSWKIN